MLSIKDLQKKVNEIAAGEGGLDTFEKLERARQIARDDAEVKGLLLEILDEALARRCLGDMRATAERFLAAAGEY